MNTFLSTQTALAIDGGLTVFRYYGFEPSKRPQRINPFRQERTSSFYVLEGRNNYYFKDFGDDTYKGDARRFVELMEDCSPSVANELLTQIYNLRPSDWNRKPLGQNLNLKKKSSKLKPETTNEIQKDITEIKFRPFSKEELSFWFDKGLIDESTLLKYNVQAVHSFCLNYLNPQTNKTWQKEWNNLNFVFAFEIIPNKVYKLYQPLSQHRYYTSHKTAFLPNLKLAKETLGDDYMYDFALDSLNSQESAILCGGEPDCLALLAKGYNAFTLGAEVAKISDYTLNKLKTKGLEIAEKTNIRVLYDADYTGIQHSKKIAENYHFTRLVLPKLEQQVDKNTPKPIKNDVCDYLQTFAWDEDLELELSKKTFKQWEYHLPTIPTFQISKYLSEKAKYLIHFLKNNSRVQLAGEAGIGKTFTLLREIASQMPQPILFVVPYAIQVEQIEREYQKSIPDLVCFPNEPDEKTPYLSIGQINVCTYDRAPALFALCPDLSIWVDESHLLTSAYNYRKTAIQGVLNICQKASQVMFLSATPDYSYCQTHNFQLIRFQRKRNPLLDLKTENYNGKIKESLWKNLIQNAQNKTGITVVRLNDKKLAKNLAQALIQANYYQKEEIDYVFSSPFHYQSTPSRDSIIEQGLIPKSIKLLFVTACFDCGINIYNTDIQQIIIAEVQLEDNSPEMLIQVCQRFRLMDKLPILVLKPQYREKLPWLGSAIAQQQQMTRQSAQNRLNLLGLQELEYQRELKKQLLTWNNLSDLNIPLPKYLKPNADISADYKVLSWEAKEQTFQINEAYLRWQHQDFLQKKLSNVEFFARLGEAIPNLQIQTKEDILPTQISPIDKLIWEDVIKNNKDIQKQDLAEICTQLKEPDTFFTQLYPQIKDIGLKQKIKFQFIITQSSHNQLVNKISISELALNLSHRYFQLQDYLLPNSLIPHLLKENASDSNYGFLQKALGNQIKLLVQSELGNELGLLMRDTRLRQELDFLNLLIHWIENDTENPVHTQKNTQQIAQNIKNLQYDLKILLYQQGNLHNDLWDLLQSDWKQKTQIRQLKKQIGANDKQIEKLKNQINKIESQLEKSQIKGWEVNQLSQFVNSLRPSKNDWVGVKANLRLLKSLFHIKIFTRKIWEESTQTYTDKTFAELGKRINFADLLSTFGLDNTEINTYLDKLRYQIQIDKEDAKQKILSKNESKANESLYIINYLKPNLNLKIGENELGYPKIWDN